MQIREVAFILFFSNCRAHAAKIGTFDGVDQLNLNTFLLMLAAFHVRLLLSLAHALVACLCRFCLFDACPLCARPCATVVCF